MAKNVNYDNLSGFMKTKTIISLRFKGRRYQVVEYRQDWSPNVRYDILQDRRIIHSNCTIATAVYELFTIMRREFIGL